MLGQPGIGQDFVFNQMVYMVNAVLPLLPRGRVCCGATAGDEPLYRIEVVAFFMVIFNRMPARNQFDLIVDGHVRSVLFQATLKK